jgi:hypothetical protein
MLFGKYASRKSEARYPSLWNGLEAYYTSTVYGPTGTTVFDLSGRNVPLSVSGATAATAWGNPLSRNSWQFNAVNSLTRTISTTRLANGFSVSVWFNSAQWGSTTRQYMFAFGTEDIGMTIGHDNATYRSVVFMRGGGAYPFVALPQTGAGTWLHAGITWNGTTITGYFNGIAQGTASNSTFSNSASETLRIGNYPATTALTGNASEFAVHSRVLKPSEMRLMGSRFNAPLIAKRDINFGQAASVYSRRSFSNRVGSRSLN